MEKNKTNENIKEIHTCINYKIEKYFSKEKYLGKLRKQKGITLIALVVTVIVLLLLAGIAISALSGENRNIKKGSTSKRRSK